MSGTRGGIGRIAAMGIALAVALVLVVAARASAEKYEVAQCGWFVGADASWSDTTGGAKFRPDSFCVPGPGGDPFDGVHMKTLTREGEAGVSGTRFGGWRWTASPGTGITKVRASWWHALHDGFEQRVGGVGPGGFEPFRSADTTDTTPAEFVQGFAWPVGAFEDRLLCTKAESKACLFDAQSWSGLRAITLTVEDPIPPLAGIGGQLIEGGWQRGTVGVAVGATDGGSGIPSGETLIDGSRVGQSDFPCHAAEVGGELKATAMRPCELGVEAWEAIQTAALSDGPHQVWTCTRDFAGARACSQPHGILIDNNPPAHPRAPEVVGGEGWRRTKEFDVSWTNPDQGQASPLVGAGWQLTGPHGYDSGATFVPGRDLTSLPGLTVPAPGEYTLSIWLRDEAGNEAPAAAATLPLRFDDVKPTVAFLASDDPAQIVAEAADADSGPAVGTISYRRADASNWTDLATKLVAGPAPGKARLIAAMPNLGPGTWLFKVEVQDAAGNVTASTLRADGTEMSVHRNAPGEDPKTASHLFARLHGGDAHSLTVSFGAAALLGGRLARPSGEGIAGRTVRVTTGPMRGSTATRESEAVTTGEDGRFELHLPAGPSRTVGVSFAGDAGADPATRPALRLLVRSGVSLRVTPRSLRNGQAVRFAGRVRGRAARFPRRGKLVEIEYLDTGSHRWRPVMLAHTDRSGRFRAHYRFRYITSPTRIRLRATALAEQRWPYAPGSSRPVTVHVGDR
jgi:hypothetical protein